MNSVVKSTVIFLGGLVVGGFVTNLLVKEKYEHEAAEEISAMHKSFVNRYKEPISEQSIEKDEKHNDSIYISKDKNDVIDYASFSKKETSVETKSEEDISKEDSTDDVIELKREISDDPIHEIDWEIYESSEEYGFSHVELVLYTEDCILANVYDEKIDDVEKRITVDILNKFAHLPKDEIWVRNEILGCDFNIVKDNRKFSDVVGENLPSEEEVDVF